MFERPMNFYKVEQDMFNKTFENTHNEWLFS